MRRRTGERLPETMPAFVRFAPSEMERVPRAYIVQDARGRVADVFRAHGIAFTETDLSTALRPGQEWFALDSLSVSPRAFQNVRMQTAVGRWTPGGAPPIAARTPAVRVEPVGPLARVVFMLCEPRSPDGLVAWGLAGDADDLGIWRLP